MSLQRSIEGESSKAYTVVLHAKPATRLREQRIQFVFPGTEDNLQPVTITGLNEKAGEKSVPVCLELRVQVYAADINDALHNASSLADSVASFITVATGVGTPVVKPVLA